MNTPPGHSPEPNRALRLRRQLFWYVATGFAIFGIAVLVAVAVIVFRTLRSAEEVSLLHTAEIRTIAVEEWIRRGKDVAAQITSRTRIREELEAYNAGEITLEALTDFTAPKLEDAMSLSTFTRAIVRLDPAGAVVAECGFAVPDGVVHSVSRDPASVLLTGPLSVSANRLVVFSAPITGKTGELAGTDLVFMDLAGIEEVVTRNSMANGNPATVVGALRGGYVDVIVSSVGQSDPSHAKLLSAEVPSAIQLAAGGSDGLLRAPGHVVAYMPVGEGSGWSLVVSEDRSELYAPLYARLSYASVASLVLLGVVLYGLWFLTKPLSGRLLLGADELQLRIDEQTALLRDEIEHRRAAENGLHETNLQLRDALASLKSAQDSLVAQQRMAAVGQLSAGIAHDFNNILTGISGYTQLVLDASSTSEETAGKLQNVMTLLRRATDLVRQLLDFSRKSMRQLRYFSLATEVEEMASVLKPGLPEGVALTVSAGEGPHNVLADPFQVRQVVTNLVQNAVDAMTAGGELRLSVERITGDGSASCTTCGRSIAGSWICLSVTDTGDGIPADILPHVFEPFFTTRKFGRGSGLGLSQVSGIVAQHGGHTMIESAEGAGTRVRVFLPPDDSEPPA